MLGDDFLSGLDLPTLPCLVGGLRPQVASVSHVEKLQLYPNEPQMMGLSPDTTVHQIRILTEVQRTELQCLDVSQVHIHCHVPCTICTSTKLHGFSKGCTLCASHFE